MYFCSCGCILFFSKSIQSTAVTLSDAISLHLNWYQTVSPSASLSFPSMFERKRMLIWMIDSAFLQSNAEKLELSINVWTKNDVANCFWLEWSIAHFLSVIYATEKFHLNSFAECRGRDALTPRGIQTPKTTGSASSSVQIMELQSKWGEILHCRKKKNSFLIWRGKQFYKNNLLSFQLFLNFLLSDTSYIIKRNRNWFVWTTINLIFYGDFKTA